MAAPALLRGLSSMKRLWFPSLNFGTKLLLALLVSIGTVLTVTFVIVRRETNRQVASAADRAMLQSRRVFYELEEMQHLQLQRLGQAFTQSPRTIAALEAARDGGDLKWLAETVSYELDLRMLPKALAAFTDPAGEPVLTIVDGLPLPGDPAALRSLVPRLWTEGLPVSRAYRVVAGRLYLLEVHPVRIHESPVGTASFGLPLDDELADRIGQVVGAEVCFIAAGRCVAGTQLARGALLPAMAAGAGAPRQPMISLLGRRWQIIGDSVATAPTLGTWRMMAVPMDPILAPFDHIRTALALAGGLAIGLALLLGIGLSRQLTRPVGDLSDATTRVARGDYTARVVIRSRDELGTLAESFNEMAAGLLLKERYRGVLDKIVSPEVAEKLMIGEIRLGGENREVTTLFADIVSFCTLIEGMEPQKVIGLLNECMERLEACVHAEGGIVDKYVGDAIMAVFGAPTCRSDDPLRAVRAAIRMQQAMGAVNERRGARDETPVHLAIGVHTGIAVAGNMGSPNRMNYTVLGDAVNLASRLCNAAGAGEILVSEATYERVHGQVFGKSIGTRQFKGFSNPIAVFSVECGSAETLSTPRPRQAGALFGLLLAFAMLVLGPSPLGAQDRTELPTLAALGLGYVSPSGALQVDFAGRFELEGYIPHNRPVGLIASSDALLAGRVHLLTNVFVGPALYGMIELRIDRGEAPSSGPVQGRIEQGFIRIRLPRGSRTELQVGKFALPFGGYGARQHSVADPFIRPPLPYDYRTVVAPSDVPASTAGFLTWRDDPARRPAGAPPIWAVPYPWGAIVLGSAGPVMLRIGAIGSAPSSAPDEWKLTSDRLRDPSWVAGMTIGLSPELSFGASFDNGPYRTKSSAASLPPGTAPGDFYQQIWGIDWKYSRGRTTVRGEAFMDHWQVPNVDDDPGEFSYYIETTVKTLPGVFLAARFGQILFERIEAAPFGSHKWDHDVRRVEIGAGYRIVRNAEIRAQYLDTNIRSPRLTGEGLWAAQLWWEF